MGFFSCLSRSPSLSLSMHVSLCLSLCICSSVCCVALSVFFCLSACICISVTALHFGFHLSVYVHLPFPLLSVSALSVCLSLHYVLLSLSLSLSSVSPLPPVCVFLSVSISNIAQLFGIPNSLSVSVCLFFCLSRYPSVDLCLSFSGFYSLCESRCFVLSLSLSSLPRSASDISPSRNQCICFHLSPDDDDTTRQPALLLDKSGQNTHANKLSGNIVDLS